MFFVCLSYELVLVLNKSCDAKLNGREQNINKRMTDMLGASSVFVPQSYRIVMYVKWALLYFSSNPEEVIRAYSTVACIFTKHLL